MACTEYRPDHNGECLTCDEPAQAHSDYVLYRRTLLVLDTFAAEIKLKVGWNPEAQRILDNLKAALAEDPD